MQRKLPGAYSILLLWSCDLVCEIAEVRNSATFDLGNPISEEGFSTGPQLETIFEVLNDGVSLASCEKFLGEKHSRTRNGNVAGRFGFRGVQEILLTAGHIAGAYGHAPKYGVGA